MQVITFGALILDPHSSSNIIQDTLNISELENSSPRIRSWCSMLVRCSAPTLTSAQRESRGTSTPNVLTLWELRIMRLSTLLTQEILQGSSTIVVIQIVRLASGPSKTRYVSASLPKRTSKKMKSWLLITSSTSSKQLSPSVTAVLRSVKASSEWPEIQEERMILPLRTRSVMRRSWTQILETSLSTRKSGWIERRPSWLQAWTKRAPSASLARRWSSTPRGSSSARALASKSSTLIVR